LKSDRFDGKRSFACKKDNDLRIYTWNLRSLSAPGASIELLNMLGRYKTDLVAVQELNSTGQRCEQLQNDKKEKYYIYYSCQERIKRLGCGFVVGPPLRDKVIASKPNR
jgi:exonuclease III